MKLSTATVNGLFGTYDHSIELDPEGLTFIHSTNGMGKSVFMKLIHNLLSGRLEYLERIPFDRMDLGFDDGSRLIAQKDGGLRVLMQKNELEETMSREDLMRIKSTMYISPERLTVRDDDGDLRYAVDIYTEELEQSFLAAKARAAVDVDGTDPGEDMSDEDLEKAIQELKPRVDFISGAGLGLDLPSGYRMTPTRYDISRNHGGYLRMYRAVSAFADGCGLFAESAVVFRDIINTFFFNKSLSLSDGRIHVTMGNGETVPTETLSSGEKHLMIIFYRLLFHVPPGSLVIIDEPEISIHVSWQQKMGRTFLDLCGLRDLQMIVATHSPQIIHDMWDRANELGDGRA